VLNKKELSQVLKNKNKIKNKIVGGLWGVGVGMIRTMNGEWP
jgi:hypothetical protein